MHNRPLVAILTAVYNGDRFLRETMQCVQTIDYPNLVHVVLDNASTDRTPDIIESFLGKRVPVIARRNAKTIPKNDNHNAVVGMIPTESKYFRVLCADDLMAPSAIREMVELAESDHNIAVVSCRCQNCGILVSELPLEGDVLDGREIVRRYLRRETNVLSGTNMLFRRSAVEASPLFYDPALDCCDSDAAIRETLRGKFGFVHKELAFFRLNDSGHSATVTRPTGAYLFEWLIILDRYGQQVLFADEYAECRKAYRRHLLRRALMARLKEGGRQHFDSQMGRLAEINDSPNFADFAGALAEWLYFAATLQRYRVGAPRPTARRLNGLSIVMPRPTQRMVRKLSKIFSLTGLG